MAINKNALIRYKTIDKCLQNIQRNWTLHDLISTCSDALYEYEGKDVNVSKRTIQMDIQIMRSDKLGYNAPIEVYDKKYYRYSEEGYSIMNIPLTDIDMQVLSEAVEMLKQFKDFSLFNELNGIVHKLEDKVYAEKMNKPAVIHLDKNEDLKGLEYIDVIYQAILKEICLEINYQSFRARNPSKVIFNPYIIKEFNNRWFVVGRKYGENHVLTFALDRIFSIDYKLDVSFEKKEFDADEYYKDTIGVTVLKAEQLMNVELEVDAQNTPYVITKPFHPSQQILETKDNGSVVFSLHVHHNFELERLILGFGDSIKVLKPRKLRSRIKSKLKSAYGQYVSP